MTKQQKPHSKLKHLSACLLPESQYEKSPGFEKYDLVLDSLPQLALSNVCLKTHFCSHELLAPICIAPMTGGVSMGGVLNSRWAQAAEHFGIAMGVGSQRLALEDKSVQESFKVRKYAKSAFIFANLGGAQLALWGYKKALEAISMIEANAIFIHLNPLQEACQKGGDTDFNKVLEAISGLVAKISPKTPVFVREVGFGLSVNTVKKILSTKAYGIDCAGAGGTSWSKVEALCSSDPIFSNLGQAFGEIGIPTVESIINVRSLSKTIPLIATGGIRNGLDIFKTLALGANIASLGQPMLKAAMVSEKCLFDFIDSLLMELRVSMYSVGVKRLHEISNGHLKINEKHSA